LDTLGIDTALRRALIHNLSAPLELDQRKFEVILKVCDKDNGVDRRELISLLKNTCPLKPKALLIDASLEDSSTPGTDALLAQEISKCLSSGVLVILGARSFESAKASWVGSYGLNWETHFALIESRNQLRGETRIDEGVYGLGEFHGEKRFFFPSLGLSAATASGGLNIQFNGGGVEIRSASHNGDLLGSRVAESTLYLPLYTETSLSDTAIEWKAVMHPDPRWLESRIGRKVVFVGYDIVSDKYEGLMSKRLLGVHLHLAAATALLTNQFYGKPHFLSSCISIFVCLYLGFVAVYFLRRLDASMPQILIEKLVEIRLRFDLSLFAGILFVAAYVVLCFCCWGILQAPAYLLGCFLFSWFYYSRLYDKTELQNKDNVKVLTVDSENRKVK
jgi:hypothetical protein